MSHVVENIRCGKCGELKPLAAFSPSIVSQGYGRCRDCSRTAQRAARANDPERFKGYRRDFLARNSGAQRVATAKWTEKKKAQGITKTAISCSTCEVSKPVSEFQPSVAIRGSGTCKECKYKAKREYERRNPAKVNAAARLRRQRNIDQYRSAQRDHYRANRDAYRNLAIRSMYGISLAEYEAMLAQQGGKCACCGATKNPNGKRLFVDHDHETGAIRGIICNRCNRGIGSLGDTIEGVRRALNYLERAQQRPLMRSAPSMRVNLLPAGAN